MRHALGSMCLVFLGVAPVNAATIRVPEDYASILAAVDSAAAGDTVLVGPGTWTATDTRNVGPTVTSCAFIATSISIVGAAGAEQTIVQGLGEGPADIHLLYRKWGAGTLTLDGLTFTGSCEGGGAVFAAYHDSLIVRNCRFVDVVGAEVVLDAESASIVLDDCLFSGNDAVCVRTEREPAQVQRCRWENNDEGVWLSFGRLEQSEFVGNGTAARCRPSSYGLHGMDVVVEDNVFSGNDKGVSVLVFRPRSSFTK